MFLSIWSKIALLIPLSLCWQHICSFFQEILRITTILVCIFSVFGEALRCRYGGKVRHYGRVISIPGGNQTCLPTTHYCLKLEFDFLAHDGKLFYSQMGVSSSFFVRKYDVWGHKMFLFFDISSVNYNMGLIFPTKKMRVLFRFAKR